MKIHKFFTINQVWRAYELEFRGLKTIMYKTYAEYLNEVQSATTNGNIQNLITLGARCLLNIDGKFFLLLEIEIGEQEQVIVIGITSDVAAALMSAGIEPCQVVTEIPTATPGTEVNLICVFVVDGFAFLVFDVENNFDVLVIVRVPLCIVIGIDC